MIIHELISPQSFQEPEVQRLLAALYRCDRGTKLTLEQLLELGQLKDLGMQMQVINDLIEVSIVKELVVGPNGEHHLTIGDVPDVHDGKVVQPNEIQLVYEVCEP